MQETILNDGLKKEEISKSIISILKTDFSVRISNTDYDINLFTPKFNFKPRDMIYLMILLEKKYQIKFSIDDIDNLSFYTIYGLSNIIMHHIGL
ncbi:MAG: hypothetical protein FWC41_14295 [Firmicutes bacterium]|nr:hypothetical protein [Bacillota bacterium]